MHEIKCVLADQLFGSKTRDPLYGRTQVADGAVVIQYGDDVEGGLYQRPELGISGGFGIGIGLGL